MISGLCRGFFSGCLEGLAASGSLDGVGILPVFSDGCSGQFECTEGFAFQAIFSSGRRMMRVINRINQSDRHAPAMLRGTEFAARLHIQTATLPRIPWL